MKKIFYILIIFCLFEFNSLLSSENLKSTENQADYLVIYHPEFKETIKEFVEWRRLKGVNVLPIDVNDIYNQFGDTVSNVDAIRDFVSYSLEFWNDPKPRYLLLVGGINHIPSKRIESSYHTFPEYNEDSVSIDEYFAINKYDSSFYQNIPDIAMGRFPSRNINDLKNIIDKTIVFEDKFNEIEYRYDALISTDKKNFEDFENYANNLIETLPANLSIKRFYSREESEFFGDKDDFIKNLNDGTTMLFNFFHGSQDVWMHYSLINSIDVDTMILTDKPFIINSISCSQNFDNKEKKSILEIFLSKQGSGAVASIAANGLSQGSTAYSLIMNMMQEIFLKNEREYGVALLNARKISRWPFLGRYPYLGDPMLRLPDRLFEPNAITEYFKNVNLSNFPNPCDEYTNIMFSIDDDTNVELDIFNILGNKIENLYSGFSPATIQNIRWNTSNLNNGIYICRLKSGKNVFSKTISISR